MMQPKRRKIKHPSVTQLILLTLVAAAAIRSSLFIRLHRAPLTPTKISATTSYDSLSTSIGGLRFGAERTGNSSLRVVDAVFTYVNGTEPNFLAELAHYTKSPEAARYRDVGQLRYGLRSVLRYAPWIRRIHVVVSDRKRQVPRWLDASHPAINVVEHRDIWEDPSKLPTFSSPHIQWNLHRIPGLSSTFLYFDDDFQLTSPLDPEKHLRTSTGEYVLYEAWTAPTKHNLMGVNEKYGRSITHVGALYDHRYGRLTRRRIPAHAPTLIDSTIVGMIREEWKSQFDRMYNNSLFRNEFDMQYQFSYQQYIHSKRNGAKERLFKYAVVAAEDALHYEIITDSAMKNGANLRKVSQNPRLFLCLQDGMRSPSEKVLSGVRSFYEEMFSAKAPWEVDEH